jgi:hypothetical protein
MAECIASELPLCSNLFMSEDEKKQQLGDAVADLNVAKVEYAHLERKLERILTAYRETAKKLDKTNTDSKIRFADGKVIFDGWSTARASELMNESELSAFLFEFHHARIRVKKATQVTRSLGLTSVS